MNNPQPPSECQHASAAQRVFARLTDVAIIISIFIGLTFIPRVGHETMFFSIMASFLILVMGYDFFCDGLFSGQGIGKRIFGIRVVDARSLNPCSVGQAGLRIAVLYVPFMYIIEFMLLAGGGNERLGDKLAKTFVLRVNPKQKPVENLRPINYSKLGETLQRSSSGKNAHSDSSKTGV